MMMYSFYRAEVKLTFSTECCLVCSCFGDIFVHFATYNSKIVQYSQHEPSCLMVLYFLWYHVDVYLPAWITVSYNALLPIFW